MVVANVKAAEIDNLRYSRPGHCQNLVFQPMKASNWCYKRPLSPYTSFVVESTDYRPFVHVAACSGGVHALVYKAPQAAPSK